MVEVNGFIESWGGIAGRVIDDQVGIVRRLWCEPNALLEPEYFHFAAQLCDLRVLEWVGNPGRMGGVSQDRRRAATAAVAEALRCYCASFYRRSELPLCRRAAAPFDCVPPTDLVLFSREQYDQPRFPYTPFTDETPIRWVGGVWLADRRPVSIPAAVALYPYSAAGGGRDEASITPASLAGLAAGLSWEEALWEAVAQLLRDDALVRAWLTRTSLPQVRVETLSDLNYDLVARFERSAGDVTLFRVPAEGALPVILACLRGRADESPALVTGAGADPDPERAVTRALECLAAALRAARQTRRRLPPIAATDAETHVTTQETRLRFWADHGHRGLTDFLFASDQRLEIEELSRPEGGDVRRDVLARLHSQGRRIVVCDLTTPDLRGLGLSVVRAVVPGLRPLFIGHAQRASGGPAADNSLPHPFFCQGGL